MSIADLKTRLHDVPGIETLTMVMEAGRQNYTLNGRVIAVDAAASDFQVEQATRTHGKATTRGLSRAPISRNSWQRPS